MYIYQFLYQENQPFFAGEAFTVYSLIFGLEERVCVTFNLDGHYFTHLFNFKSLDFVLFCVDPGLFLHKTALFSQ